MMTAKVCLRALVFATCWLMATNVSLAGPADSLMGTWNVISRPGSVNTCGEPAENSAHQWIVAQNGTSVTVTVQGTTSFPQLAGTVAGKRLTLEGEAIRPLGTGFAGVYSSSVSQLEVTGKTFKGKRYYLGSKPRPSGGTTICIIEFDTTGSRQ